MNPQPRKRTMSLADAAEAVLREVGGGPLHYRAITETAMAQGILAPRSATPWIYLHAAVSQDIRRREARGQSARFAKSGRGFFRLHLATTTAETAVGDWNSQVKRRLLE